MAHYSWLELDIGEVVQVDGFSLCLACKWQGPQLDHNYNRAVFQEKSMTILYKRLRTCYSLAWCSSSRHVPYYTMSSITNYPKAISQHHESAHEVELSGPATAPTGASEDSEGTTPFGIILSMGAFVLYIKTAIVLNLPVCHQSHVIQTTVRGLLASYCPTGFLLLA